MTAERVAENLGGDRPPGTYDEPSRVAAATYDGEEFVECAGCGSLGQFTRPGVVINVEHHEVPALCSRRPLRVHGPWLPSERRP